MVFYLTCISYIVIKPWMTELQKQKLKRVPDANKLLAYFKAEDLPRVYGGTCECPGGCVLGRAAHDVLVLMSNIIY